MLREGEGLEQAGEFEEARDRYQAAAELDPLVPAGAEGVRRVNAAIVEQGLRRRHVARLWRSARATIEDRAQGIPAGGQDAARGLGAGGGSCPGRRGRARREDRDPSAGRRRRRSSGSAGKRR